MSDPRFDLFEAINKQDVDKVVALLRSGTIDVNKPFESEKVFGMFRKHFPLNYAVHELVHSNYRSYHVDNEPSLRIIDLLLDAGADFNAFLPGGRSIISNILDWPHPPEDAVLVKNLLLRGLDPNSHAAIFRAVYRSDGINEAILLLLAFGADKTVAVKIHDYSPEASTSLSVAEEKLANYIRSGRARELRHVPAWKEPPRDRTEDLRDLVAVLRAPPSDMETIKNVLMRMVRRGELSAENAIFIIQRFRITYNPSRRHAVAAYARPLVHPPSAKVRPPPPPSPQASPNPFTSAPNDAFNLATHVANAKGCTGGSCAITRRGGRRHTRRGGRRHTRRGGRRRRS